jgi:hypothetical protein
LDGAKIRFAGEFVRKIIGEPIKKTFVAYYIDFGATTEQREALRKLFTGPSFAATGQPTEVKEVAMKFENMDAFGQVGKTASGTVGEILSRRPVATYAAQQDLATEPRWGFPGVEGESCLGRAVPETVRLLLG